MRRIALVAVLAGPMIARAELPPPRLAAVHVDRPPKLDGRLDDPAWQRASVVRAFVQKFPHEGAQPVEPTSVRVLYDDEAIWFGIECEQTKSPITARLTRRDRPIEADSITIDIDSRHDGTSAFEFTVNAAGVLADGIRFNDTEYSSDWDENWEARVARTGHGWSAELRIPLRALRFDAVAAQSWGLQVRRHVSARQETDEWSYIPRTDAGEVSRYGTLEGLRDLRRQGRFDLRPFVLGRVRHRDPVSGLLANGWDAGGSAGLDLKWHITPKLILDGAFNPDFAQVEADQVILNLTTYELLYPEKRAFFLEGNDVFSTPIGVLYTRRIGHAPDAPYLRDGAPYSDLLVDVPSPSTIYGAVKLAGAIGSRLRLGVLSALTARNTVEVQQGPVKLQRIAEPLTLHDIARLRWAAGRNFDVGLIAAATNRFEPTGLYPIVGATASAPTYALCPDGTQVGVNDRCFHDAYVGGPDVRLRSPLGDYVAQGQAVLTGMSGGPARQMRDGTFIGAGDLGVAWFAHLAKQGGRHWLWDVTYDGASSRADYNDLGFMPRQNFHRVHALLEYRTTAPWAHTLETHWRAEVLERDTLRALNLARRYALDSEGKLDSFWSWFAEVHYRERNFDDREVGDGTALQREALIGLDLEIASDPRRRLYFELATWTQVVFNGLNFEANGKLVAHVLPQLDIDLQPMVSYTFGEPRYAGAGALAGELLFGKLTAGAVGATLRATYTFAPRLSLQIYTQLFLAYKHYDAFQLFSAGNRLGPLVHLDDLHPTTQIPSVNPDLEESILNVNVVLRWEYRLGSTLYFVYTRSQVPDLNLMTGERATLDFGALRSGPAADALLLKLTYWWN